MSINLFLKKFAQLASHLLLPKSTLIKRNGSYIVASQTFILCRLICMSLEGLLCNDTITACDYSDMILYLFFFPKYHKLLNLFHDSLIDHFVNLENILVKDKCIYIQKLSIPCFQRDSILCQPSNFDSVQKPQKDPVHRSSCFAFNPSDYHL